MTNAFVSKLSRSFLTGVLSIGALLSPSHAVAQGTPAIVVKVPFAFQNGSQHYPAGTYRIDMKPGHVMQLRGSAHDSSGFALTSSEQRFKAPETGKVVFRRYGDHLYIREVWVAGETTGYRLGLTREEKQDQKIQTAKNAAASSNAEVALSTNR
jgi:hypothetical protein